MRGDEAQAGTLLEDSVSLVAVDMLEGIETKLMGCIGFGIERHIAYAHVMENIAALVREGGFLGACALVQQMQAYQLYQDAVLYVQDKPFQDPSVINSSIISATRGHYGNYHLTEKTHGSRLWISPLMPLYWFFDLAAVAQHSLLYSQLQSTIEFSAARHITLELMRLLPRRPYTKIPLE
jgi:hypothetical protein